MTGKKYYAWSGAFFMRYFNEKGDNEESGESMMEMTVIALGECS